MFPSEAYFLYHQHVHGCMISLLENINELIAASVRYKKIRCPHFFRRFTDDVPEFWHGDRLKEDVGNSPHLSAEFLSCHFCESYSCR